jgi:hypothetical protein
MKTGRRILAVAVVGLLSAGPAVSGTIDFGSVQPRFFGHGATPSSASQPVHNILLGKPAIASLFALISGLKLEAFSTSAFQRFAALNDKGSGASGGTVSAVPLPPAVAMLLAALAGLFAMRRRKSA